MVFGLLILIAEAIAALALMFIVPGIERYIMLPRLVGKRVNLSPVELLYIILLAYYLVGLIGAFPALP